VKNLKKVAALLDQIDQAHRLKLESNELSEEPRTGQR